MNDSVIFESNLCSVKSRCSILGQNCGVKCDKKKCCKKYKRGKNHCKSCPKKDK